MWRVENWQNDSRVSFFLFFYKNILFFFLSVFFYKPQNTSFFNFSSVLTNHRALFPSLYTVYFGVITSHKIFFPLISTSSLSFAKRFFPKMTLVKTLLRTPWTILTWKNCVLLNSVREFSEIEARLLLTIFICL